MRTPLVITTLAIVLEGCAVSAQPIPSNPTGFVDEQIAQSAASISLAQRNLQQTSPRPAVAPAKPVARPVAVTPAPIVANSASAPVVIGTPKAAPAVHAAPAVPAAPTIIPAAPIPVVAIAPLAASAPTAPAHAGAINRSGQAPSAPATAAGSPPVPPLSTVASITKPPVPFTPKPVVVSPPPPKVWRVGPEDKTIREALAKWAHSEGWTFNPVGRDYWTVPQDFDVVASDTFTGPFKDAVRKLIASTELTSTPLQPCFFSNRAVRVVPINEECAAQAQQRQLP